MTERARTPFQPAMKPPNQLPAAQRMNNGFVEPLALDEVVGQLAIVERLLDLAIGIARTQSTANQWLSP